MIPPAKDDVIVIVGAGVFGLSTALDLEKGAIEMSLYSIEWCPSTRRQ